MKLRKLEDVTDFLKTVEECTGEVYLTSAYGDRYSLKSKMSTYVAMGELLGEHGDELELWCDNKDDEARFLTFFCNHQNVL